MNSGEDQYFCFILIYAYIYIQTVLLYLFSQLTIQFQFSLSYFNFVYHYKVYCIQISKSMLLKTRTQVKLTNKYDKILHFCPVYNDTYILLAIRHQRTEVLSHVNSTGQIIKQRIFQDSDLQPFGVISDRQVIILDVKDNLIIQWNLETNCFIQIPFLYKDQLIMETCELFIFPETRSFCIVELGGLESNFFRLSYFHYPLQNGNQEAFLIFEDEQIWNYNYLVRKGNNHSMVCWFQPQKDQQLVIKTFDFREETEGEYNQYKLEEFNLSDKEREMEITVTNIWEIRPYQMMLVCLTNQDMLKNHRSYPNSNYVLNVKQWIFRKANFAFEGCYQNQLVDNFCFGAISMFRGYDFDKGKPVPSPIYYIDNLSQEIVATEEWLCSHRTKYELLPYCTSMLIECEYEDGNVDKVTVMTKEIKSRRLISASFVDDMIEDCDENLIQQIIKLIEMY